MENNKLIGIPVSNGIASGDAHLLLFDDIDIKNQPVEFNKGKEQERFNTIVNELITDAEKIISKYKSNKTIISIIEAEIMFLKDTEFRDSVSNDIENGKSCSQSLNSFFDSYQNMLNISNNAISRKKSNDLIFLKKKLSNRLLDQVIKKDYSNLKGKIVVSSILDSEEIIKIYEAGALTFATEYGSNLSHSSIISRSLNIPAVFGIKNLLNNITNYDKIIVDGNYGEVYINPSEEQDKSYRYKQECLTKESEKNKKLINEQIYTKTGDQVKFYSNLNSMIDLDNTIINRANGIGLVRTENLIEEIEQIFDEDYQKQLYSKICTSIFPNNVTFRLFDFGYDKLNLNKEREDNPALGLRGVRYLIENDRILEIQIRALLKACDEGNLNILLPIVSNSEEIKIIKGYIERIAKELGVDMPKIGSMIETISFVFDLENTVDDCDFYSLGTNDLMQYFFAADRGNSQVEKYLNYKSKAFKRLLKFILRFSMEYEKQIVVCGQLSSNPESLKLLYDIGYTEFSVVSNQILNLKKHLIDN